MKACNLEVDEQIMHNSIDEQKYQDHIKFRNEILELAKEQQNLFDKHVLTLSAGGIGLSLILLGQLSPNIEKINILMASWIFWGIAIISTLMSFLVAVKYCDMRVKDVDHEFETGEKTETPRIETIVQIMNYASCVMFILGAIMLCYFTVVNLA